MTKEEKIKINLKGKDIGLRVAKLYVCGLNLGLIKPKLDYDEENDYLRWKYILNVRNDRARIKTGEEIYKKLDKKDYLVDIINLKINEGKRKYCEEHGHKEKKGSAYIQPGIEEITHVQCSRCGAPYEKKAGEKIRNPFSK